MSGAKVTAQASVSGPTVLQIFGKAALTSSRPYTKWKAKLDAWMAANPPVPD